MFNKKTFKLMQKAANHKSQHHNNSKDDPALQGMKMALHDGDILSK